MIIKILLCVICAMVAVFTLWYDTRTDEQLSDMEIG